MEKENELIKKLSDVQDILNDIGYVNAFKKELKELNDAINRNTIELSKLIDKIESLEIGKYKNTKKTKTRKKKESKKNDDINIDEIKNKILSLTEEKNKQEEMILTDPSDSEKYESEIARIDKEIENLKKKIK